MARRFLASLVEVLEIAVIAVGSVFLVRSFLVQPFLVSGSSMSPNFRNGDYLLVDELTYRFRPPERGEVIVFKNPNDLSTFFIKRIVGLPGEEVDVRNGKVEIRDPKDGQGRVLGEAYLPAGTVTSGGKSLVLGKGQYFVMGDNRAFSYDSRAWGAVPRQDIVGLVRVRLWPLDDFRAFAAPQYKYQQG